MQYILPMLCASRGKIAHTATRRKMGNRASIVLVQKLHHNDIHANKNRTIFFRQPTPINYIDTIKPKIRIYLFLVPIRGIGESKVSGCAG